MVDYSSDNVYVADSYSHRIQVFTLAANIPLSGTSITSAVDGNGLAIQNGGTTLSTSITFMFTTRQGTNLLQAFNVV